MRKPKITRKHFKIRGQHVWALSIVASEAHKKYNKDKYFKEIVKELNDRRKNFDGRSKIYVELLVDYYNQFLRDPEED